MGTKANSVQVAPLGKQYLQLHAPAFRRSLLRWFGRNGRDLPWRRTRDPYHIMVSEFMLQQTQVIAGGGVLPPVSGALSHPGGSSVSPTGHGAGELGGIGLLSASSQPAPAGTGSGPEQRRASFPRTTEELRRLPESGGTPPAAVASFAFEREVTPIDTNVGRVLRRVFHFRARSRLWLDGSERSGGNAPAQRRQESLDVQPGNHGAGCAGLYAGVPHCGICPVRAMCQTAVRETGRTDFSIAPATSATRPKVPVIEATIRWRARSSSK